MDTIITLKSGVSNQISFCVPSTVKVQEVHDLLDKIFPVSSRYTSTHGAVYEFNDSFAITIVKKLVFTKNDLEELLAEEAAQAEALKAQDEAEADSNVEG